MEVTNVINNLDTRKAVGHDLLHNMLLKSACSVLVKPLTTLFNKSIAEGIFPSIWKTAHVTPIHKKDSKSSVSNYRPISPLSCVGEILEKCMKEHLNIYLNENELISKSQSGFTNRDSTVYQLLNIYDDFSRNLDNNITTQAIFFIFQKHLIKSGIGVCFIS